jgi:hypothetical protein
MILYAILQLTEAGGGAAAASLPSAADGVRAINRHLRSLGVFGSTAYLHCVYGSSELAQGFCRLCAVWGGIYMLNSSDLTLELSADRSTVVAVHGPDGGQRVGCKSIVLNSEAALPALRAPPAAQSAPPPATASAVDGADGVAAGGIARCVCLLDGPVVAALGDDETPAATTLAVLFPPRAADGAAGGGGASSGAARAGCTVFALQVDAEAGVCPKGQVVLHLSAPAQQGVTPEQQLRPVLDALLRQQAADASARRAAAASADDASGKEASSAPPAVATNGDAAERSLPRSFIESALSSRAEYEASLSMSEDDRIAAEHAAAARAAAAMAEHAAQAAERAAAAAAAAQRAAFPEVSVLWGAFFELHMRSCVDGVDAAACPANLHACDNAPVGVDCEAHVARARDIFARVCPDSAFLPAAEEAADEEEDTQEGGAAEGASGEQDAAAEGAPGSAAGVGAAA